MKNLLQIPTSIEVLGSTFLATQPVNSAMFAEGRSLGVICTPFFENGDIWWYSLICEVFFEGGEMMGACSARYFNVLTHAVEKDESCSLRMSRTLLCFYLEVFIAANTIMLVSYNLTDSSACSICCAIQEPSVHE